MNNQNPEPITLKPDSEHLEDGLETNLIEIARMVFSKPAQPPYSIGLQLDHEPDSERDPQLVLNEMLTLFMLAGVEVKWGSDISMADMTPERMEVIQKYMWSIGFDPIIEMEEETQSFTVEFKPYQVRV